MNGPPTPPAVSPVEKRDQERDTQSTDIQAPSESTNIQNQPPQATTSSSIPAATPSHAPPSLNVFQHHLQSIIESLDHRNISGALQRLDYLDKAMPPNAQGQLSVAFMLVLCYMIEDKLSPAYEVLLRLPSIHLARAEGGGLWGLFSSVWEKKHERVYERAQSLHGRVAASPSDLAPEVVPAIQNLLITFTQKYRVKVLNLLAVAYEAVPASLMERYLGLPATQLLSDLEKEGWSHDSSKGIFKPPNSSNSSRSGNLGPSTLNSFRAIANNVTRLEL